MGPVEEPEKSVDVEVYVREPRLEALLAWVERTVGRVTPLEQMEGADMLFYDVQWPGGEEPLRLTVTPHVEDPPLVRYESDFFVVPRLPEPLNANRHRGPSTSLFFVASRLPWATDAECGRQLSRDLGVDVMCQPLPHYPVGAAPVFLLIRGEREELFIEGDEEPAEA